jgi:hypothetical protein
VDDVQHAKPEPSPSNAPIPKRLTGLAALKLHATLATGLVLCTLAFSFELGRAEGGNELSWAYVFEWPLLSVFAVYMWWKFLHPDEDRAKRAKKEKPTIAPEYEGMLAGWQESQRALVEEQMKSDHEPPPPPPQNGTSH